MDDIDEQESGTGYCSECHIQLTKNNMWSEHTCILCAIALGLLSDDYDPDTENINPFCDACGQDEKVSHLITCEYCSSRVCVDCYPSHVAECMGDEA